jgi:hypothetical protein
MKRTASLVSLAALVAALLALGAPRLAVPAASAQETASSWKGEIVDLACYLAKGAHGEGHKKCAQECARAGEPLGFLADGKLYLLVYPHGSSVADEAKKLCGSQAEVSGTMLERDGMRGIEVKAVKG